MRFDSIWFGSARLRYYSFNRSMTEIPTSLYLYPDGGALKYLSKQLEARKQKGIVAVSESCRKERERENPKHNYVGNYPCENFADKSKGKKKNKIRSRARIRSRTRRLKSDYSISFSDADRSRAVSRNRIERQKNTAAELELQPEAKYKVMSDADVVVDVRSEGIDRGHRLERDTPVIAPSSHHWLFDLSIGPGSDPTAT